VGPFQHQSPQRVWVVCTTAQTAVALLNWAHPLQGVSATQIVWGSFLCTQQLTKLFRGCRSIHALQLAALMKFTLDGINIPTD
ncbi:MAG: hypothetical protein AB8B42_08420, partial [Prochlorococcus sp.]